MLTFTKNTSWFHKFLSVDIQKSGPILTTWKPLAVHPRVKASHALIGLGCSFKNRTTEFFLFCELETNSSTRHNREILSNQDSISRFFCRIVSECVPSYARGSML